MSKKPWFTKIQQINVSIMYHETTNKHIDIHFQHGPSVLYVIDNKEVASKVKFNAKGELTQTAKKALLKHVQEEISKKLTVSQGHSTVKAETTYQPILETKAEVLKITKKDNIANVSLFMPEVSGKSTLYMCKIDPDTIEGSPVLIFGEKNPNVPHFIGDKLKLKKLEESDIEKYKTLIDPATNTIKEDGAAMYVYQDTQGTRIFSHRVSSVTGLEIEHTGKVPEIAGLTNSVPTQAMAEISFYKDGKVLTAAESAGHLNRNKCRDKSLTPRLAFYRVDMVGTEVTSDEEFFTNRARQKELAKQHKFFDIVKLKKDIKINRDIEGYVGCKKGEGVNTGIKIKFKGNDIYDWRVDRVDIKYGPTSTKEHPKLAGKVYCTSTNSGKTFELGVNCLGDREEATKWMNNPENYIGRVLRVNSLQAAEGRSATINKEQRWHTDKGIDHNE